MAFSKSLVFWSWSPKRILPQDFKVFFLTLPPWFFSGEGLETKVGHDWNEVKTMCKHDEMAGICTFFVSSKGLGVCLKGLEMNNYLSFLSAWAGFAYDDWFSETILSTDLISSKLYDEFEEKQDETICMLIWTFVYEHSSISEIHGKHTGSQFTRLHHPACPFTLSVQADTIGKPVEGFRFPSEHPICDGSQWFKGWQFHLDEGTKWAMREKLDCLGYISWGWYYPVMWAL